MIVVKAIDHNLQEVQRDEFEDFKVFSALSVIQEHIMNPDLSGFLVERK